MTTERWEVWHYESADMRKIPLAELRGEWTDEKGKPWGFCVAGLSPYVAERLAARLNAAAEGEAG
jgi:hypothetical protein